MEKINIAENTIKSFQNGELTAFSEIYDKTKKFVYNIIYRMTHNVEESNDLTHDVYIKIWENRDKYTHKTDIKTWIYRVAVNHTLNTIKKRQRWNLIQGKVAFFYKQQVVTEEKETDNHILELLQKVNLKYRPLLVLKDVEEKSYEEIALIMDLKIGTVRSRLNRGRKQLLDLYKNHKGNKEE